MQELAGSATVARSSVAAIVMRQAGRGDLLRHRLREQEHIGRAR